MAASGRHPGGRLHDPGPAVLGPGSEFTAAARAMLELGVRHLPIVDNGRLVAVLSMRDLLDAETSATR